MAFETALEVPVTQAASAIEGIFVQEKPVSPSKTLLLAFGSIGDLIVGVMWVFVSDFWWRARVAGALLKLFG